jgi:alginate O-acetyltransferase complex protein AlgI
MVFSTHIFVFYFLPLFLLVYFALPGRWRNAWITLASYVFYGWWQPWFVGLMLLTTCMDFVWGKVITRPGATRCQRRAAVAACVITNLSLLAFFKYYVFTATALNELLAAMGAGPFRVMQVVLPIGISFYTFHSLTYIVDLYRGDATPAESFTDFSAFVALFPDLVAGPIIRYKTLAAQLARREHTADRFASGLVIFIIGFAKKLLLANPVGVVADAAFRARAPLSADAWVGVLAYALQIYFDFCGYSDMAVGLGRMLGFEFPRNFDAPYRAGSITDFWRRWHTSLSSVLRDYLYFPLGGNRKGPVRTYVNLFIVMLLGGLWHGAKWNFVVWGAYHGLLLGAERLGGKRSVYETFPRPLRVAITSLLVVLSWVLFRADSLTAALHYYASMFGLAPASPAAPLLGAILYSPYRVVVLVAGSWLVVQPVQAHDWAMQPVTWPRVAGLVPLFVLALMVMFAQSFNPFLYFQF